VQSVSAVRVLQAPRRRAHIHCDRAKLKVNNKMHRGAGVGRTMLEEEILSAQDFVNRLRTVADRVGRRMWVASPFIGNWSSVRRILGSAWIDRSKIDCRLLTDIEDNTCLSYESVSRFLATGQVKGLVGLHAKVYIFDDLALVGSANLTATGFAKRYELGVLVTGNLAMEVIAVFEKWWKKAMPLPRNWAAARFDAQRSSSSVDEPGGPRLRQLWKLPEAPKEVAERARQRRTGRAILATGSSRKKSLVYEIAHDRLKRGAPPLKAAELAEMLNRRGVETNYGDKYKGKRGTLRLVSSAYAYAIKTMGQKQADEIAQAFVNARGKPAYE